MSATDAAATSLGYGEAALLGLVQGLTEFLPVSSSAHLRIVGPFLPSGGDPGAAFTAITQLGTEAAVLIYFRRDVARMARAWWASLAGRDRRSDPDARLAWLVVIGSLPIVLLGLLFQDAIETSLRHLALTATMLIAFGVLLGVADRIGSKHRSLEQMGWWHGVVFGFAQALALIPGVSRSGGTITAGLMLGYSREAAARYSFLLALPAVFGSGLYQLVASWGSAAAGAAPTALATAIAFCTGYVVIVAFLKLVSSRGYMPFVAYRIALGVCVLVLLQTGVLDAV